MSKRRDSLLPPAKTHTEDPGAHDLETDDEHFSDAQSVPAGSPHSSPIPTTRVEKVSDEPSYGEVPGTEAYRLREGDALPDEITILANKGEDSTVGRPVSQHGLVPTTVLEEATDDAGAKAPEGKTHHQEDPAPDLVVKADGRVEVGAGTTEPAAQEPETRALGSAAAASQPPPLSFPVPDFGGLDGEEVLRAAAPYVNGLYAADDGSSRLALPALGSSVFLTPRSASLWSQLVAPPPLQPPDWIRSRIRRLFLVSLGVPVDLDEILPASKQKKLVLPSLSVRRDSPRTSTDSRGGNGSGSGVARLKQPGANTSNTSVDSQGRPAANTSRKRKGPPPPPALDLVAAEQLCATTDEALDGMTDDELRGHLDRLQALELTARAVLDFWTKRTDEKIGDREAFEGVIENLVAHARKTRK
ncbi:hypothetical protein CMQ_8203 [Grosmannia clavigera kw1407]|uniref:Uncharacterized protein n=1 Tax=Grosmannia clavigera (strain kw1407 / UAMH 11150) TaxID=655863 RepID=F0XKK3_GROCL|nr:uncharacterized protein CMQ_8203 [Grosmannia clavigera kw1407]EFX01737.1 hypothetical protein CMQ_8203 [Grosmannia clavigera kw1407]